jgi:hypothetical protein
MCSRAVSAVVNVVFDLYGYGNPIRDQAVQMVKAIAANY